MRTLHIELRPTRAIGQEPALPHRASSSVQGLQAALELLREIEPEVIVLDLGTDETSELSLSPAQSLSRILDLCGAARVIVTGDGAEDEVQEMISLGAFDYIIVPDEVESLKYAIDRALRFSAMDRHPAVTKGRRRLVEVVPGILTSDPGTRRVARRVERVANHESRVILQGEPGTGRKTLARLIALGKRGDPAAIANGYGSPQLPTILLCSSGTTVADLNDALDPSNGVVGRSSMMGNGRRPEVVVLESVDELNTEAQAALLRRLGEINARHGDRSTLRLLSLATAQLGQRIAENVFRRDLYDRLAEVHLCLPPLRARGMDAVELADHFLQKFQQEAGRSRLHLSPAAIEAIREHEWPGNVAELRNAVKQAVLTAEGPQVKPNDLGLSATSTARLISLREAREDAERAAVQRALKRVNGNIARASEVLGISRPTLYDLLNKLKMR